MRILTIAVMALLIAGAANAQANRHATTKAYVDSCVAEFENNLTNPEPACACTAGILSGSMTDAEYEIVGRLIPHLRDDTAMDGAISEMVSDEGYTVEQILATAELMGSLAADASRTCDILSR